MPPRRHSTRGYCLLNSGNVNKLIRARIRPLLRDGGFSQFTNRTARRHLPHRIDVVNFQSYNSYLATQLRITTYSFQVNLGMYFPAIPERAASLPQKDGRLQPNEWDCHFRRLLVKTLDQPELPRSDIWFVAEDGSNLEAVMEDVAQAISQVGFPWFERHADLTEVLRVLQQEEEDAHAVGWGFGTKTSPIRHYFSGYIALALGRFESAADDLDKALASGLYEYRREQMLADIRASVQGRR
jgi:hypothetical protein